MENLNKMLNEVQSLFDRLDYFINKKDLSSASILTSMLLEYLEYLQNYTEQCIKNLMTFLGIVENKVSISNGEEFLTKHRKALEYIKNKLDIVKDLL